MPKWMLNGSKHRGTGWSHLSWAVLLLLISYSSLVDARAPDFEQIFEQHGVVMLWIEPDSGQIVDANPAAVVFYGHSREQPPGCQRSTVSGMD